MPINLEPRNENGQQHGLWVSYWETGGLDYKGVYVNGLKHGMWESYWVDGKIHFKGILHNDIKVGLWVINNMKLFYAN